ncbi:Ig-like domain-containing protein [candidate division KSB1 bacterium]|nr:Ig-like domain-containing protein [candidate division KSB1 bacterium]
MKCFLRLVNRLPVVLLAVLGTAMSSQAQVKIMPLGDSITHGVGSTVVDGAVGGYRDDLASLLAGAGINFDFVGTLNDGAGFDADHEGHGGWRADQIETNIFSYLNATQPDVVLLHVGTNDISQDQPNTSTILEIESIVDEIHDFDAAIKILVSSLVPRNDQYDDTTTALNALIQALVKQKHQNGYTIFFAGNNLVFKANPNWQADYLADFEHPNDSGYALMAEVFFNAIQIVLTETGAPVTDNFNRSKLGATWVATPALQIVNNEMDNTSNVYAWDQIAIYAAQSNPQAVSFKWGSAADQAGISESGLALGLDKAAVEANGYLIFREPSGLSLWTIENGQPSIPVQQNIPASRPFPKAGDTFKVVMSSDASGHHFDVYINDLFDGRITDSDKREGNAPTTFSGVMLKGNLSNNIDDFNLSPESSDDIPPGAITDLAVTNVTATTVFLSWTAPGDDGDGGGPAAKYDLRYGAVPITDANFYQATAVVGLPAPKAPGTGETFLVSGLKPSTTYYFAIKAADEVFSFSPLSNVPAATTALGVFAQDDFNRSQLGPNWKASPEIKIVNGELSNTATAPDWNYMAVFKKLKNPTEVSYKWGQSADAPGINEGGFALMLDDTSTTANGYLLFRQVFRPFLTLWTIVNGAPAESITDVPATQPGPFAGDSVRVVLRTDGDGHHFSYFVNGKLDAVATDSQKQQGNAGNLYSGVMLRGNLKNNIDDFTLVADLGKPANLLYISGNDQEGEVGAVLRDSLAVQVTDVNGSPVPEVAVNFAVIQGNGSLVTSNAANDIRMTNGLGQAFTYLKLDTTAGENKVQAEVAGLSESPIIFSALGKNATPATMLKVSGDGQQGTPGAPLANPFVVSLKDRYKNVVANYPVTFVVTAGSGTLSKQQPVLTNVNGEASTILTLGATQIINKVEARVDGMNPIDGSPSEFVASAAPGSPSADSSFVEASPSTMPADGATICHVTINVRDKLGLPIAGVPVNFDVSGEGNDEKQPANPTDAQGKAYGSFTSTRAGIKTITAKIIGGIDITRSANVTVTTVEASNLTVLDGNDQTGNVNSALPAPLVVKIGDKNGNGVANYEVQINVEQGGGKLVDPVSGQLFGSLPVKTDSAGIARIIYICGPTPGENRIRVSAPGLSNSPFLFLARAIAPQPAKLAMISGNSQQGTVGEVLAQPVVVRVADSYDRPVWGVPVTFSITLGNGFVNEKRQIALPSDAFGEVKANWRLGLDVGLNVLRAESAGLSGSPIDFQAQANPGEASAMLLMSGNPVYGDANSQSEPLVVQTVDRQGHGVEGVPVIFELIEGAGTLTDNYVMTGSTGLASAKVDFGSQSGWRKVRVSSEGLAGSPLIMQAYARPLDASSIHVVERTNNQNGTKGKPLNFPLQVQVRDGLGNPVPGVQVNFVVTAGGGQIDVPIAISDTNGIASARWTLGASPGSNQARAIKNSLANSPVIFSATGFDNNFPIIDDLPDWRAMEYDLIRFSLSAADDDNDPIRFGAKNLPAGSTFDSLGTRTFAWQTDGNSAGRYEVSFLAYDTRGGVDEEIVIIDVQNRNQPPRIISRFPVGNHQNGLDTTLAQPGATLRMQVTATDPDGDVLSYRWYLNGVFAGSISNTFDFHGNLQWNTVEALVFDLEDTVRTVWSIKVPVELVNFAAQVGEGPGVKLSWKTGSEINNAGFNVLRGGSQNGHYAKINERLIPANRDGNYGYLDITAETGARYYYKLETLDKHGNVTLYGPIVVNVALPEAFDLSQNYPNPFGSEATSSAFGGGNPTTQIRYQLPRAVQVSLTIYNMLGQEVRKLMSGQQPAGYHTVVWDGRDQSGRPAPSGVYFYRLQAGSFVATRKMLLAK